MSDSMMMHAKGDDLAIDVDRTIANTTVLGLRTDRTTFSIFLTESQLTELSTVLTDAIAERVDCEECDDGHIIVDWIPKSETTPEEAVTEICETCDGRGWVIPTETVQ